MKKIKKYSRSGNKREIREIVSEEVHKEERTRKPRNGSRKKEPSSVKKTEDRQQIINQFSRPKNLVKVDNGYLFWKCEVGMVLGTTRDKNEALLFSEFSAKRFCTDYKINNYTLEEL